MPGHEQYNARCRREEVSTRVVIKAEEVRVQNMTERANIPFTSEKKFGLNCHIMPQEDEEDGVYCLLLIIYTEPTLRLLVFPTPR